MTPSTLHRDSRRFSVVWLLYAGLLVAGIISPIRQRKKTNVLSALLFFAVSLGFLSQAACGGGASESGNTSTPPGDYKVTVAAVAGSLTHTTTLNLSVH